MSQRFILLSLFALLSAGCGGIAVRTDYDRQANFPEYRTYRWLEVGPQPARQVLIANELVRDQIQDEIDRHMSLKGFRQTDVDTSDLAVAIYLTDEPETEIRESGYRTWNREIQYQRLKPGTLVIDIVHSGRKELVWRGWATGVRMSPDEVDQSLADAVAKILERFPPDDLEVDAVPPTNIKAEDY